MTNAHEIKKYKQGFINVIGCDEVGRGCLAGPVVAAAVVLPIQNHVVYKDIKDSKLLSSKIREKLSGQIKNIALAWSIAEVSPEQIDSLNIHNASLLAMRKAIESLVCHSGLDPESTFLYIDGKFEIPNYNIEQEAVVGGDNKVLSIAAASIIAKVYRDELMQKFHKTFPLYNFSKHKGYATEVHREAILKNGLSPLHRVTFCESFY